MKEGLQKMQEAVGLKPRTASVVHDRFPYPWMKGKQASKQHSVVSATKLVWPRAARGDFAWSLHKDGKSD